MPSVCRRIIGHDSLSQCPIIRWQRAHSPDGGLTCAAATSADATRVLATTGLDALSLPLLGLRYCTGSCGRLALRLHRAILGLLLLLQSFWLPGILKPLQRLRGTGNPESMSNLKGRRQHSNKSCLSRMRRSHALQSTCMCTASLLTAKR